MPGGPSQESIKAQVKGSFILVSYVSTFYSNFLLHIQQSWKLTIPIDVIIFIHLNTKHLIFHYLCTKKKLCSCHRWLIVPSYLPYFHIAVHFHWSIVTVGWLENSWRAIIIKGEKFFSQRSFRNIITSPCSFQINFKYLNA